MRKESAVTKAIAATRSALEEGFGKPDDGLIYHQRYALQPQELLMATPGPERMLQDTVRRMLTGIAVEMLRERWRVPGIPRFTFTEVPEGAPVEPGLYPGSVLVQVDVETRGADLKRPEREHKLREALVAVRGSLVNMGRGRSHDPAADARALADAVDRLLAETAVPHG